MWSRIVVALGLVVLPAASFAEDSCFVPLRKERLAAEVMVQSGPNAKFDILSRAYGVSRMSFSTNGESQDLAVWSNRCDACGFNSRANPVPFVREKGNLRTRFTSVRSADACTLAQLRTFLGQRVNTPTEGLVFSAAEEASPGSFVDVCLLPKPAALQRVRSVVLDYEPQDGRSPAQNLAFLTTFARTVKAAGKSAVLYTNPLNGPALRKRTNLDAATLRRVVREFDYVSVMAHRKGDLADLRQQLALLDDGSGIPHGRVVLVLDFMGLAEDDIAKVRSVVTSAGIDRVIIFQNSLPLDTSCTSPYMGKLGCLLYGRCGVSGEPH